MSVGLLQEAIGWRAGRVRQLIVRPADAPEMDDVVLTLGALSTRDLGDVIESLGKIPSVTGVSEVRT